MTAPVHRLARLPALIRAYEHYLSNVGKRLLREFDREIGHFSSRDIGAREAAKIRHYLVSFKRDLARHKYKKAGKDFDRLMDEISALERQFGK